jgi:hypothetical protein
MHTVNRIERADGMSQTLFEAQAVASSLEALGLNCHHFWFQQPFLAFRGRRDEMPLLCPIFEYILGQQ